MYQANHIGNFSKCKLSDCWCRKSGAQLSARDEMSAEVSHAKRPLSSQIERQKLSIIDSPDLQDLFLTGSSAVARLQ